MIWGAPISGNLHMMWGNDRRLQSVCRWGRPWGIYGEKGLRRSSKIPSWRLPLPPLMTVTWTPRISSSLPSFHHVPSFKKTVSLGCSCDFPCPSESLRHGTTMYWPFLSGDFPDITRVTIWRFPEIGVPPVIIHLQMGFPWNKPSSDKGVPPWLRKPP